MIGFPGVIDRSSRVGNPLAASKDPLPIYMQNIFKGIFA